MKCPLCHQQANVLRTTEPICPDCLKQYERKGKVNQDFNDDEGLNAFQCVVRGMLFSVVIWVIIGVVALKMWGKI